MPSSLTRVISRALEYSSHPPVSVLVRSPSTVRAYFLEALSTSSVPPKIPLGHCLKFRWWIYLPAFLTVPRTYPTVRMLQLLRQPITIVLGGAGIFNLLSIAYAFRPRLRDRLTQGRRALPWKPWIFGEEDFHFLYRYSCHAFSLVSAPALLTVHLRRTNYALLPLILIQYESVSSALCFSPVYYRRKASRLVSCYALFKWWLPLSQHTNCLRNFTTLLT